jgi:hypothetical protein
VERRNRWKSIQVCDPWSGARADHRPQSRSFGGPISMCRDFAGVKRAQYVAQNRIKLPSPTFGAFKYSEIWRNLRPLFNPFDSLIGEVQRRAVSSERPLQVMARFFLQRMRQAMVNRIMYAMNDDWPVSDDHGCKMNESVGGSIGPKRTRKSRTVRQQTLKN